MGLFDFFKKEPEQPREMTASEIMKQAENDPEIQKAVQEAINGPFFMKVTDVFSIGQEVVVTGLIERGTVSVNDTVKVEQTGQTAVVTGLEQFMKKCEILQAGQNAGIRLANISRNDLEKGYNLVK